MNNRETIVELVDITLTGNSGETVFDGLNFGLLSGQSALIVGPTGSGKTSLAEIMVGARRVDAGTVLVFDTMLNPNRVTALAEIRRRIGGVGGIFDLISYQTVSENLTHPLVIRGGRAAARRATVEKIMGDYGISSHRREMAYNLPRGERVLVMLARAVIANQPLVILDEPLAGLDAERAGQVHDRLQRLALAGHSLVILTSGGYEFDLPETNTYHIVNGRLE